MAPRPALVTPDEWFGPLLRDLLLPGDPPPRIINLALEQLPGERPMQFGGTVVPVISQIVSTKSRRL